MDVNSSAAVAATVLLGIPLIGLAGLGILFIMSFTTYKHPLLPKNSPGLAQRGQLQRGARTAHIEGDFVVFIIGAVVHNYWDFRAWLPVFQGMGNMLKELTAHPECGFLGGQFYIGRPALIVQYWRSFEHLHEYARAPSKEHFPAWVKTRAVMRNNKSFGIYHEAYKVRAGEYECIYANMHPFGLGGVMGTVPIRGKDNTARGRIGETKGDDHPDHIPIRAFD